MNYGQETYPGSSDPTAKRAQSPCPGRDLNETAVDYVARKKREQMDKMAAEKHAADTAGGSYLDGPSIGGGIYGGAGVGPTSTPANPPVDQPTTREFLYANARDPKEANNARKWVSAVVTDSDANWQAFVDIVALHFIEGDTAFFQAVSESAANQIALAKLGTLLDGR
jgi:hypothetical protein